MILSLRLKNIFVVICRLTHFKKKKEKKDTEVEFCTYALGDRDSPNFGVYYRYYPSFRGTLPDHFTVQPPAALRAPGVMRYALPI